MLHSLDFYILAARIKLCYNLIVTKDRADYNHKPSVTADAVLEYVSDLVNPLIAIERATTLPLGNGRLENVGEHSFALALLAGPLAAIVEPSLDVYKVTTYANTHDVIERFAGDTPVYSQEDILSQQETKEARALQRLLESPPLIAQIGKTYQEYNEQDTPEKRFVYVLDKIYPHLLALLGDARPTVTSWEVYQKREITLREEISSRFPPLLPLFDDLCQRFRQKPHFFSTPIPSNES